MSKMNERVHHSQGWWCTHIIPAFGSLRQEDVSLRPASTHHETLSQNPTTKKSASGLSVYLTLNYSISYQNVFSEPIFILSNSRCEEGEGKCAVLGSVL
jgi:hypothetical protein